MEFDGNEHNLFSFRSDPQKLYEEETGEKAMYQMQGKSGVDYHTLKYVRWLESFVTQSAYYTDEVKKGGKL